MRAIPFVKMDGLGNDFVIIDARKQPVNLTEQEVTKLGDRHKGVGFDQLFILHNSQTCDVKMDIYNSDGSTSAACGNGTRCVASIIFKETAKAEITLEAPDGKVLKGFNTNPVTVNMGRPALNWQDIPLAKECDTLNMPVLLEGLPSPVCVSMGNPHTVFFVDNVDDLDIAALGPKIEHHPLFPKRTNVEFAQIISPSKIRMRVWERGAGITLACGSGSCATIVAAVRRGLTGRKAEVVLDGGSLFVEWTKEDEVLMQGAVNTAFSGTAYL